MQNTEPSTGPPTRASTASRRLLFVVTKDWYFVSHRLELAAAAAAAGWDVSVATSVTPTARDRPAGPTPTEPQLLRQIAARGIRLFPVDVARAVRPWRDLRALFQLARVIRNERPHVVHLVANKAVLLGGLAALTVSTKDTQLVPGPAGLGYLFTASTRRARLLRMAIEPILRFLLNRPNANPLLQNEDDRRQLQVDPARSRIIPGTGVDLDEFSPAPQFPVEPVRIVLVGRMLWGKGIGEFVAAARALQEAGSQARCILVGSLDPNVPDGIPEATIKQWQDSGLVEWWGHRDDMPAVYREAHIACLPSYREGMPKTLIEAAACGLPLVATDVPGCREVVHNRRNGLLVPAQDGAALTQALRQLVESPQMRAEFGTVSRELAASYSQRRLIDATLTFYSDVVNERLR